MPKGFRSFITVLILQCLAGCTQVPFDFPRQASYALGHPEETRLGRMYEPQARAHPGDSGFQVLSSGTAALATRLMLIDAAEQTLDVQYYLFAKDLCGMLIVDRLCAAADRGVRVRLLIDDWEHTGLDRYFATIAAHPNIELRLFNPVDGVRDWPVTRPVAYVFGPRRLLQHMHNKALVADGTLAVIGGRNLANEYFGAGSERNFGDMDLLAVGPVAQDVSSMFDLFWNHQLSIPIEGLCKSGPSGADQAELRAALAANARQASQTDLIKAVRRMDLDCGKPLPLVWCPGEFLYDHPDKTLYTIEQKPSCYMVRQLQALAVQTRAEALIISPYFVPGPKGMGLLRQLRDQGVRIKVLTNSLASNDVRPAHVAYRKYRRDLLAMGVDLFELRPDPARQPSVPTWLMNHVPVLGSVGPLAGQSAASASLHAKTMVLDRQILFVGSFNFDPRSMRLDTQDGIVLHSEELANGMGDFFDIRTRPHEAYRVMFRGDSPAPWWQRDSRSLWWVCQRDGSDYRYPDEPLIDPWDRFWVGFVAAVIPEEWM